ncbi:hypothetical protein PR048_007094 [Dryococelus australis]|uniref:Uncharacterized protein n=1 Tax=Dryococelus australis TaxID=614101 RepID=A0ABQ9ICN7_9NEOP|nr:hypothetical protein PR048_007094 [Dryococelus australis]
MFTYEKTSCPSIYGHGYTGHTQPTVFIHSREAKGSGKDVRPCSRILEMRTCLGARASYMLVSVEYVCRKEAVWPRKDWRPRRLLKKARRSGENMSVAGKTPVFGVWTLDWKSQISTANRISSGYWMEAKRSKTLGAPLQRELHEVSVEQRWNVMAGGNGTSSRKHDKIPTCENPGATPRGIEPVCERSYFRGRYGKNCSSRHVIAPGVCVSSLSYGATKIFGQYCQLGFPAHSLHLISPSTSCFNCVIAPPTGKKTPVLEEGMANLLTMHHHEWVRSRPEDKTWISASISYNVESPSEETPPVQCAGRQFATRLRPTCCRQPGAQAYPFPRWLRDSLERALRPIGYCVLQKAVLGGLPSGRLSYRALIGERRSAVLLVSDAILLSPLNTLVLCGITTPRQGVFHSREELHVSGGSSACVRGTDYLWTRALSVAAGDAEALHKGMFTKCAFYAYQGACRPRPWVSGVLRYLKNFLVVYCHLFSQCDFGPPSREYLREWRVSVVVRRRTRSDVREEYLRLRASEQRRVRQQAGLSDRMRE